MERESKNNLIGKWTKLGSLVKFYESWEQLHQVSEKLETLVQTKKQFKFRLENGLISKLKHVHYSSGNFFLTGSKEKCFDDLYKIVDFITEYGFDILKPLDSLKVDKMLSLDENWEIYKNIFSIEYNDRKHADVLKFTEKGIKNGFIVVDPWGEIVWYKHSKRDVLNFLTAEEFTKRASFTHLIIE